MVGPQRRRRGGDRRRDYRRRGRARRRDARPRCGADRRSRPRIRHQSVVLEAGARRIALPGHWANRRRLGISCGARADHGRDRAASHPSARTIAAGAARCEECAGGCRSHRCRHHASGDRQHIGATAARGCRYSAGVLPRNDPRRSALLAVVGRPVGRRRAVGRGRCPHSCGLRRAYSHPHPGSQCGGGKCHRGGRPHRRTARSAYPTGGECRGRVGG